MAPRTRNNSVKRISQDKPPMIGNSLQKKAISGAEPRGDVSADVLVDLRQQNAAVLQEIADIDLALTHHTAEEMKKAKGAHANISLLLGYFAHSREFITSIDHLRSRVISTCVNMLEQGPGIWEGAQSQFDHTQSKLDIYRGNNLAPHSVFGQVLGSLEEMLRDEDVQTRVNGIPAEIQAIDKIVNQHLAHADEGGTSTAEYVEYPLLHHFLTDLGGTEEQASSLRGIYQHLITRKLKCNDKDTVSQMAGGVFLEWQEKLAADNGAPGDGGEG